MRVRARWMRGLVVASISMATLALAAQEPVNVQAVRKDFGNAYRKGDWDRAVDLGYELEKLVPNSSREQYNLACVLALNGEVDASLDWLGRAAANGFCRVSLLDADSDLDAVRDLPGYQIVRNTVSENTQRRRDLVFRNAAAATPLTVVPKDTTDRPRPLIIALHGFGDSPANYPYAWGPVAEDFGAILLVPNGPRIVGNGRGWGNVDEAEAVVEATIEYARKNFEVDWERVVLTGFSQGGFMAMALAARHPDLFAGVIPMAGGYIPEIDAPAPANDGDPRYYFMVGSRDRAAEQVRLAAFDFEAAGYEVDLRVLSGIGHTFPRRTTTELRRALRFVLGE
ncbi:MAG: dienelactone hydrolase family protein [Thermoanaerobaculales bacterium]|nr:dienelactone hydrolase family protein [Thermoanaerobaculales bacterium]